MMDDSPEGKTYVALLAGGPLVEVGPFHFSEDEKESLAEILLDRLQLPADLPRVQSFLGTIERAVAYFKQLEELERQKPEPRATHDAMTKLREQVLALRETVEAMDSNIDRLLLVCLQHPSFDSGRCDATVSGKQTKTNQEEIEAAVLKRLGAEKARREFAANFVGRFSRDLAVLDFATEMAEAILSRPEHKPKRGRKAVPWRVQYAVEVALAFRSALEIEPTATRKSEVARESIFVSVFRICLRAVGDGITDVYEPAKDAIKMIKEENKLKSE